MYGGRWCQAVTGGDRWQQMVTDGGMWWQVVTDSDKTGNIAIFSRKICGKWRQMPADGGKLPVIKFNFERPLKQLPAQSNQVAQQRAVHAKVS